MKLFVWQGDGVLEDYNSGLICVLAEDLEQALKLIEKKCNYCMQSFPTNKYTIIEKPEAFICWGSS